METESQQEILMSLTMYVERRVNCGRGGEDRYERGARYSLTGSARLVLSWASSGRCDHARRSCWLRDARAWVTRHCHYSKYPVFGYFVAADATHVAKSQISGLRKAIGTCSSVRSLDSVTAVGVVGTRKCRFRVGLCVRRALHLNTRVASRTKLL